MIWHNSPIRPLTTSGRCVLSPAVGKLILQGENTLVLFVHQNGTWLAGSRNTLSSFGLVRDYVCGTSDRRSIGNYSQYISYIFIAYRILLSGKEFYILAVRKECICYKLFCMADKYLLQKLHLNKNKNNIKVPHQDRGCSCNCDFLLENKKQPENI